MTIEKIEIENFRGFKGKHEVVFQPDVNVFIGVDGAGKSSILDLLGKIIGTLTDVSHGLFSKIIFKIKPSR